VYNYHKVDPEQCEFVSLASVDELPNGERMFVEIDEFSLVVFNIGGELYAIADLCSHDNGPLGDGALEGYEIRCPRHGASFDVRSGQVQSLPATEDIPAYPVRVVDGEIQVGLPLG
jgi:3-phenylpropionate/trans-cinnamate dioxygenase ferredoxin component